MADLFNASSVIGTVFTQANTTTTGSMFTTFLILIAIIVAFFLMFGVALEWTALFIVPLMLGFTAHYNGNLGVLGALLFYISFILAKNWFIR